MASINWHEIPMVRIAIPLIAGVVVWQCTESLVPLWCAAVAVPVFAIHMQLRGDLSGRQHSRTWILSGILFAAGMLLRYSAEPTAVSIAALESYDGAVVAVITSAEKTKYGSKAELQILSPTPQHPNIRVIGYLRDLEGVPFPGDTLIYEGGFQQIPAANSPFAFDAATWYRNQGIHLRTFADARTTISYLPCRQTIQLLHLSERARRTVKAIFNEHIDHVQSRSVILAMTVGVREEMDDKLYEAYAQTGTIHILSISGLHVGIVSVLLFLLTGKVRAHDRLCVKVLRLTALLGGIWAFAFIAGLSPSIVRAAFMFSVYLVGAVLRKPVRGLNVLALSAFVFVSIDPLQINSLSFQFSYLALGGIVIFFKPLYQLIPVRSFAGKFVWSTVVLSIAAQVFLIPLLIHYFQQVSLISVLSSIVAVPAAYVILAGGILVLLLHICSPLVAGVAGQGLHLVTEGLNHCILFMSELPMSVLSGLYLPVAEVLVLCIITVFLALRILTRDLRWTYACVVGAFAFAGVHINTTAASNDNTMLAIYPHDTSFSVDIITGKTCYTTFDQSAMPKYTAREVAAFRNAARVRNIKSLSDSLILFTNNIQVIDLPEVTCSSSQDAGLRIALIADSDFSMLHADLIAIGADWYVLGSGISRTVRKALSQFFIENNQQFHDLREHGAFYLAKQENNTTNEKRWQNNPW